MVKRIRYIQSTTKMAGVYTRGPDNKGKLALEYFPMSDVIEKNGDKYIHAHGSLRVIQKYEKIPAYGFKNLGGHALKLWRKRYAGGKLPTKKGLDRIQRDAQEMDIPHIPKQDVNINPMKEAFKSI